MQPFVMPRITVCNCMCTLILVFQELLIIIVFAIHFSLLMYLVIVIVFLNFFMRLKYFSVDLF